MLMDIPKFIFCSFESESPLGAAPPLNTARTESEHDNDNEAGSFGDCSTGTGTGASSSSQPKSDADRHTHSHSHSHSHSNNSIANKKPQDSNFVKPPRGEIQDDTHASHDSRSHSRSRSRTPSNDHRDSSYHGESKRSEPHEHQYHHHHHHHHQNDQHQNVQHQHQHQIDQHERYSYSYGNRKNINQYSYEKRRKHDDSTWDNRRPNRRPHLDRRGWDSHRGPNKYTNTNTNANANARDCTNVRRRGQAGDSRSHYGRFEGSTRMDHGRRPRSRADCTFTGTRADTYKHYGPGPGPAAAPGPGPVCNKKNAHGARRADGSDFRNQNHFDGPPFTGTGTCRRDFERPTKRTRTYMHYGPSCNNKDEN